ncbi:MAG TPA: hypothetical protein PKE64_00885 [Anaerolineae bacterium]|nr:hypothetical protein [Anaerolineae bacterium]HMR62542.1 hypothetical protein [Anaerolineae bacterium]
MLRTGHFYYDLRERLGSPKLLLGLLGLGVLLILLVSLHFIYIFALLFGTLIGLRGLIGRRCPLCDRALIETKAETDPQSAFTLRVIWQCPRDGHTEEEKVKGDAGLFGVN